jgi:hypothetical protein
MNGLFGGMARFGRIVLRQLASRLLDSSFLKMGYKRSSVSGETEPWSLELVRPAAGKRKWFTPHNVTDNLHRQKGFSKPFKQSHFVSDASRTVLNYKYMSTFEEISCDFSSCIPSQES